MLTDAQNTAVVRTELDTVFFQTFDNESGGGTLRARATSGQLFKQQPLDRQAWIGEVNLGAGLWSEIGEEQTVPQANVRVANKYTITVADFAEGITLSKDFFDDNMHGVWAEQVRQLALSATATQDRQAFNLFNNSFTTTLTADGNPFIGTHTLLSGSTYSNLISGALSESTLFNATTALYTQPNQAGVVFGNEPAILVVPPKLMKLAIQLTDSVLVSDSGNNAVNYYRSMLGIEVMTNPYLSASLGGSDTAWWLLSKRHSVTRLIRQGMETALRDWRYSNNRTYFYQGNYREQYFVPDYAGAVGSTGA